MTVYLLVSLQIFHHHGASGCVFDDTAETGAFCILPTVVQTKSGFMQACMSRIQGIFKDF